MSESYSPARLLRSMAAVDDMPPELRNCVHEYGYAIVVACLHAGVSSPNRIHQLVREIWDGARNPRERRSGSSLDWLLIQAKAGVTAAELGRFLQQHNLMIIPTAPTAAMIDASLAEVSGGNVICTKREKHRRRLAAALAAGADYLERKATGESAA